MGLLDELKQQAESQKHQQQTSQAERQQHMLAIDAVLRDASRYFTELANSLNLIKPQVNRNFYIEGTAKLDGLAQGDYRARDRRKSLDHRDFFEEVSFRFNCTGAQNLVVEKLTSPAVDRLRDSLRVCGLVFDCKEIKNDRNYVERGIFTITAEVPAAATLIGNFDTGNIKLELRNIEALGTMDYQYDVAEFNGDILEELAKLLLSKPNQLRRLGKYQEMLLTSPRQVLADVKYPESPQTPAPAQEPKSSLLENLKSLIKR